MGQRVKITPTDCGHELIKVFVQNLGSVLLRIAKIIKILPIWHIVNGTNHKVKLHRREKFFGIFRRLGRLPQLHTGKHMKIPIDIICIPGLKIGGSDGFVILLLPVYIAFTVIGDCYRIKSHSCSIFTHKHNRILGIRRVLAMHMAIRNIPELHLLNRLSPPVGHGATGPFLIILIYSLLGTPCYRRLHRDTPHFTPIYTFL